VGTFQNPTYGYGTADKGGVYFAQPHNTAGRQPPASQAYATLGGTNYASVYDLESMPNEESI
jgi:hypothetical protein